MSDQAVHKIPRIGDVYTLRFNGNGCVQSGLRPGIIFQNNTGNFFSPNIVVLPLTTRIKKPDLPTHVLLRSEDTGLFMDSMVLCENPYCASKEQLGKFITTLSERYMRQISEACLLASSSLSYFDLGSLIEVWGRAKKLNKQ